MSFGDFQSGSQSTQNSYSPRSPASSADDKYRSLCNGMKNDIFAISANITSMQKLIANFGTRKDTHEMREKLNGLLAVTQDLIKTATERLKSLNQHSQLSTADNNDSMRKLEQRKLARDFQLAVDRFQSIQRVSAEKSREFVIQARAQIQDDEDEGGNNHDSAPLIQEESKRQQELMRLDNEIEFNENIIMEREQSIREIETAMHEVNEVFRDLGSLVSEQQGMIDNIESNIESSAARTGDANIELQGANRYQQKSRNRQCWLLAILTAVIIVLLVILLVFKK
eukprot:Partr_v1_DN28350_c1_g1_i4_m79271 putative SYNtaxin